MQSWMQTSYEVWYHNPEIVVSNMLSNPDFNGQVSLQGIKTDALLVVGPTRLQFAWMIRHATPFNKITRDLWLSHPTRS